MRFSAAFTLPLPLVRPSQPVADVRMEGQQTAPPAAKQQPVPPPQDLPDELDARVRLVGEWQLGES